MSLRPPCNSDIASPMSFEEQHQHCKEAQARRRLLTVLRGATKLSFDVHGAPHIAPGSQTPSDPSGELTPAREADLCRIRGLLKIAMPDRFRTHILLLQKKLRSLLQEKADPYSDVSVDPLVAAKRTEEKQAEFNAVELISPESCAGETVKTNPRKRVKRDLEYDPIEPIERLPIAKRSIVLGVPWGEGADDMRRRGFAFLASDNFPEKRPRRKTRVGKRKRSGTSTLEEIVEAGIRLHPEHDVVENFGAQYGYQPSEENWTIHEYTVDRASAVVTNHWMAEHSEMLQHLCTEVKASLRKAGLDDAKADEASSVSLGGDLKLIALQPNFMGKMDFLPLHLDQPRHEGFGKVIVVLGVKKKAQIVLLDEGDPEPADADGGQGHIFTDPKAFSFELDAGEAYVLCDNARNKCTHGVFAGPSIASLGGASPAEMGIGALDPPVYKDGQNRESITLRFGFHKSEAEADKLVNSHWS